MNKKLLIGLLIFVILGSAAVGGWIFTRKAPSSSPMHGETAKMQPQTPFTSIQDALTKSISLECQFDDDTQRKIIAHVKNGQVRADITAQDPKENGSVIIKDKKMYYWTADKKGYLLDISTTPTGTPEATNSSNSPANQQNVVGSMEKYKNDCKVAQVADTWFVLPADVTFTDMSKMMTPSGAMVQPSGMARPSEAMMPSGVPTQYQQQVEQYMHRSK